MKARPVQTLKNMKRKLETHIRHFPNDLAARRTYEKSYGTLEVRSVLQRITEGAKRKIMRALNKEETLKDRAS